MRNLISLSQYKATRSVKSSLITAATVRPAVVPYNTYIVDQLELSVNANVTTNEDDQIDVSLHGVNAIELGAKGYAKMLTALRNFKIDKKQYKIAAWNDESGYKHWKRQSEGGDHNYITITVTLKVTTGVDVHTLENDIDTTISLCMKYISEEFR